MSKEIDNKQQNVCSHFPFSSVVLRPETTCWSLTYLYLHFIIYYCFVNSPYFIEDYKTKRRKRRRFSKHFLSRLQLLLIGVTSEESEQKKLCRFISWFIWKDGNHKRKFILSVPSSRDDMLQSTDNKVWIWTCNILKISKIKSLYLDTFIYFYFFFIFSIEFSDFFTPRADWSVSNHFNKKRNKREQTVK